MHELTKLFDTYSLNARVKPAFFLAFPIVVSLLTLFEPARSWGGAAITLLTSFGVITFAANQMSTQGNLIQEKLFRKWGGSATTIMLRHSDSRLDKHTKNRYQKKLETLVPGFKVMSGDQEKSAPHDADEMYRTAANYLREHTRDTKKYPLVFKENIAYGFSRNARAFKSVGFITALLSLCTTLLIIWHDLPKPLITSSISDIASLPFLIPFPQIALAVILLMMAMIWLFYVTEKWVEVRAFSYARALLATCETI